MRIAMITINDPAGVGIQMAKAINQFTPHTCRLITTEIRYNFAFEKDLHLPFLADTELHKVEEVLLESDIFHFHMTSDEHQQLGPFQPKDYLRGKKVVHHHHGHPDFRGNPQKYQKKYQDLGRKNLLVSTPDLLRMLPGASWIPNLVPTKDALFMPHEPENSATVRVGHSPTRKDLKNTDEFIQIMKELQEELGAPHVETDIIDNTPYVDCLRRKQECHMIFDHMQGYYGVSSLEALSQGKPTIAGLDAWNTNHIKDFFNCDDIPWLVARTSDELKPLVRNLVQDKDLRDQAGKSSRLFMENVWNEQNVIKRLIEFYENGPTRA